MSPEPANAVLLFYAEPLAAALVGAGMVQLDHLTRVVVRGSPSFLERLLEADTALYTFQVKGCPGQKGLSPGCTASFPLG